MIIYSRRYSNDSYLNKSIFSSLSCYTKLRLYSTLALVQYQNKLHPWFVTGFTDAEGCFMIIVLKNPKSKIGWTVQGTFKISLHKKDLVTLELLQKFFGVGAITKHGEDSIQYRVTSLQDLIKIINHFNEYPLLSKKRVDFILFKEVIEIISRKEHLTIQGIQKIINLKAGINRGLSPELKTVFPNIIPIERLSVQCKMIINPNWLAGFASGEGCFFVNIYKSKTKLGQAIQLKFLITQHSKDKQLMENLVPYLGCGSYISRNNKDVGEFLAAKFSDIIEIIIPFFDKYPIIGVKAKDFQDFRKVAELMKNKAHLTSEGLEEIRLIKKGMNKERQF